MAESAASKAFWWVLSAFLLWGLLFWLPSQIGGESDCDRLGSEMTDALDERDLASAREAQAEWRAAGCDRP